MRESQSGPQGERDPPTAAMGLLCQRDRDPARAGERLLIAESCDERYVLHRRPGTAAADQAAGSAARDCAETVIVAGCVDLFAAPGNAWICDRARRWRCPWC